VAGQAGCRGQASLQEDQRGMQVTRTFLDGLGPQGSRDPQNCVSHRSPQDPGCWWVQLRILLLWCAQFFQPQGQVRFSDHLHFLQVAHQERTRLKKLLLIASLWLVFLF
jgi:hypothetical protein